MVSYIIWAAFQIHSAESLVSCVCTLFYYPQIIKTHVVLLKIIFILRFCIINPFELFGLSAPLSCFKDCRRETQFKTEIWGSDSRDEKSDLVIRENLQNFPPELASVEKNVFGKRFRRFHTTPTPVKCCICLGFYNLAISPARSCQILEAT